MSLTVETAAIRTADAKVHTLPRPARHCDIIWHCLANGYAKPLRWEQGFVLSDGSFVNRHTAKLVAYNANQLKPTASKCEGLFSEDIW